MKYLSIFKRYLKISFMREMEYRGEFFITLLHISLWALMQVLFFKAIYGNVNSIGNWAYNDILILVGSYTIIDGLFHTFLVGNIAQMDNHIRRAGLDSVLIRPIDAQFQVSLERPSPREFIQVIAGSAVVVYGILVSGRSLEIGALAAYIFFLFVSLSVIYGLSLIIGCLGFIFEKSEDLYEIIFSFMMFAKLPDVYGGLARYAFMLLIPIVFASYVPAGVLTGKVPVWFYLYYLVMAICLNVFARLFWQKMLKRYKSAGG